MDRFAALDLDGRPDVDVAKNVRAGGVYATGVQAEVTTAKALLKAAGLEWEVVDRPIITVDGEPVPNRKAIVRCDTGKVVGDVGEKYGIIQNDTIAELADAIRGQDQGWTWAQGGQLRGGSRVYMQLRGPSRNVGGEIIQSNISLFNAFDGSLKFSCGFSRTVIVCKNTFAIARGDAQQGFALRHTSKVDEHVKNAIEILTAAREYNEALDNGILSMMNRPFTMAGMEQLAQVLVPGDHGRAEKAREALVRAYLKAPGHAEGTVWGAFQASTYYANHEIGVRGTSGRTTDEARLESSWWGSGSDLMQSAWNVLDDEEKTQQLQVVRVVRN